MAHLERSVLAMAILVVFLAAIWYAIFAPRATHRGYAEAKRILEREVVFDHRQTIYCDAPFGADKVAQAPSDFLLPGEQTPRVNWEHAVPASALGAKIREYNDPPPECLHGHKRIDRRKCAEMTSKAYRTMLGDMYNLFPALTPVNAARGNREYAALPGAEMRFGSCGVKWIKGKFEPPDRAKGQLARATLYMDSQYEEFSLSPAQRRLMAEWDKSHPVDEWECTRSRRIEKLQGNENIFVKQPCKKAGLW